MDKQKPKHYETRSSQIISLEKGKIPPQAIDMEEVVLGAMMIDQRGLDEAIEILESRYFYKESHQHIFEAIDNLVESKNPVDLLTVSDQLKRNAKLEAVGGEFYLIQLTQKVGSSAHIEFHSRIIMQKHIQRSLIKSSNEIIEEAYDETIDVFDLLDRAYDELNAATNLEITAKEVTPGDLINDVVKRGRDIKEGNIEPGIFTPIKNLTAKAGGWRDGELIILAARPGMGKTSFALLCAYLPSKTGIPTAFFSLEMSKMALVARLISMESEVDGNKFNAHGLSVADAERITKVSKEINKAELFIDDSENSTIKQLRIKAKRMVREHGIRLIVIDYLQLMSGDEKNREQEISKISRGLKKLAMELALPIIALSQLSRAVETRGGSKRPMLSDLRESGAIEQDADMVGFIYRPEYYMLDEWDDYGNIPCQGEAEYIIAKNRNGGLVRNRMKFQAKYTKFSDIEVKDENELPFDAPEGDNDDLPF